MTDFVTSRDVTEPIKPVRWRFGLRALALRGGSSYQHKIWISSILAPQAENLDFLGSKVEFDPLFSSILNKIPDFKSEFHRN